MITLSTFWLRPAAVNSGMGSREPPCLLTVLRRFPALLFRLCLRSGLHIFPQSDWGLFEDPQSMLFICVSQVGADSRYCLSSRTEEMKNITYIITLLEYKPTLDPPSYATAWVHLSYHFGNPNKITIITFPTSLKFE